MLSRRFALACAVTGVIAAPIVPAVFAAGPLPADYPQAGCFTFADPKGDASLDNLPNDPDLDIVGLAVETTPTSLRAYANVDKLSDSGPAFADGHRYTLKFTFNGHIFSASGSDYGHGTGGIREGLAQTGEAAHTTQLGVDTPSVTDPTAPKGFVESGLKVTFDYKNSWVIWDLPIADIEKYGKATFTGALPQIGAIAQTDEYAVGSAWDYAPDANSDGNPGGTWTVGDNSCFPTVAAAPVRTVLTLTKTAKTVTALLASDQKQPIAGQRILWKVNGSSAGFTKTNIKGLATLRGLHKGDRVKATFKSVSGKYIGSSATTKV